MVPHLVICKTGWGERRSRELLSGLLRGYRGGRETLSPQAVSQRGGHLSQGRVPKTVGPGRLLDPFLSLAQLISSQSQMSGSSCEVDTIPTLQTRKQRLRREMGHTRDPPPTGSRESLPQPGRSGWSYLQQRHKAARSVARPARRVGLDSKWFGAKTFRSHPRRGR